MAAATLGCAPPNSAPAATFSRTVIRGNGCTIWNVRARPRRAASNGRCAVTSSPWNRMRPDEGLMHAGQKIDQRGLAGAVRTDQRDDLALVEREAQIVDGLDAAEVPAEPFRHQDRGHAGAFRRRRQPRNARRDIAVGNRQQTARQEEDQDDDDGAENGAVVIEEICPEHLFEQRERGGADDRPSTVPGPPSRHITGILMDMRMEKDSVGSI